MVNLLQEGHPPTWNRHFESGETAQLFGLIGRAGYNATLDFPACLLYKELLAANPGAKVILSVRDSADAWAKSVVSTIAGATRAPGPVFDRAPYRFVPLFREIALFGRYFWRKAGVEFADGGVGAATTASVVALYERHNAAVRAHVPAAQLLVHNSKEGWTPLCAFLDVGGASADAETAAAACAALGPYPRVNDTPTLLAMFRVVQVVADWWPALAALLTMLPMVAVKLLVRRA